MVSDKTWYEHTAVRGDALPPLASSIDTCVCVIGGGLAGLSTALCLARSGMDTVLLEAARLAWAASGRNGGFVSNGFAEGIGSVERRIGSDAARALYNLSREGTEFVRDLVQAHDPSLLEGEGVLEVSRHDAHRDLEAECRRMNGKYGERLRLLAVDETRQHLATPRYFQALFKPDGFQIHPLNYALMVARLARQEGARVFEDSRAIAVESRGSGFRVRTAHGQVDCAHVVHCVSALDRRIHPMSGRAQIPVATYVAVTEPLDGLNSTIRLAASDTRRASNYFRPVGDGRLLWGGNITTRISEPQNLARRMMRDLSATFPAFQTPRADWAWSGLMGYALHKMPLIGLDREGQWYAAGFGGHGLNTTAMAGLLLSRMICGGDDEYRRFAAYSPVWAGGPAGRAGVQAAYWWMQLKDRIAEIR